jgi:hypothetical protein
MTSSALRHPLRGAALDGAMAGLMSSLVLAWRGRAENGTLASALNAPSHVLFGRDALMRNQPSLRYTGTGAAVHLLSSMVWGGLYVSLRGRRRAPGLAAALGDAAAVTAVAAVVDLKLVPERLTPGFERRLRPRSVALVYAGFALGLALADVLLSERR